MKNVKSFIFFSLIILLFGIAEVFYISSIKKDVDIIKKSIKFTTMTDISISTEATFIRHKSISHAMEIFRISPSLLPYFPSDYTQ